MLVTRSEADGAGARRQEAPSTVQVLLVDDHPLFRWGLRELLERNGIQVVGEAATAAEAIDQVMERRPQVVLMDLRMPGRSGKDAIQDIILLDPAARIVALTVSTDEGDVIDTLMAGACGYLLKGAPAAEVVAAVHAAARGEDPIAPAVAHALLRRLRARPVDGVAAHRIATELTPRERDVLRRVGQGQAIGEIARALDISPKTARNHLSNVFAKLGLENRVQASLFAASAGLLDSGSAA